ncbi:SusC/RagA family TonB-linked outer membrane protein [Zobellia galactanivorans]|uniref:TonB-dependent Transducer n=1 Tax=Zobellia galactanivorans (strain DSM 12802 / CCUG 47099 / CIP 106680 / NCIMB 13871 / Dsij) TaxID=63186 RepID=G0L7I4_ZOBGA|nr:TonB-dependent receptor [Zobellia galactanivorans]CAZ98083.1 TonB-dependent Transducer [Zobellia galactanivorans]
MKIKVLKNRLKLKVIGFLLLSTCFTALAKPSNGEVDEIKITLEENNKTLVEIFDHVEAVSHASFVYSERIQRLNITKSVDFKDASLEAVMYRLSKEFPINYKIIAKTVTVTLADIVQDKVKVSGTLEDVQGVALMGVSVMEVGTQNGIVTDFDGNFSIQMARGGTLEFSYMGMLTQTMTISEDQSGLIVVLKSDEQMLEEVVVIGYGSKSKEKLIDAVNKVDVSTIENRPLSNAANALQGVSPGLNITQSSGKPGQSPRINIRGFTSINGGSPLVIVDGVEGDINNLNPSDIESVSVLKDAGASAIYGARGAFGVVLVTTKKAKKGNISVNVNHTTAFSSPTMNTDFLTDPYKSTMLVDEAFRTAVGRSYTGYTEQDYDALLEVSQDPSKARVVIDNRNGRDQYVHYGATDWWNTFFRKSAPSNITNVSLSGGSDKVRTFFSYRNYESTGILKVQDDIYKQYNLRGKIEVDANDWLTFTNNMQFNRSNDLQHGGSQYGNYADPWGSLLWVHAIPAYSPTNPDGNALWRTELNNYTVGDGVYAALLHGKSKQETVNQEFSNIATAVISPFEGLDITTSYALRKQTYNRYQRSTRIPYSIFVGEVGTMGSDRLKEYNTQSSYDAFNIYGEYKKQLGDHFVSGMVGFNQESFETKSFEASKLNSISDDLNSLGLATSNAEASGSASAWALQGVFYRLSYDYKKKYLLEMNGRYDGSSRFPSDYRWGFFPSVSAGWVVSNEDFLKEVHAVSQVKLRASYGSLGNQNIDDYAYIPTLNKDIDFGYAMDGSTLDYIESPNLNPRAITWEEVKTLNLGTDLSFFKNRLTTSFDWYQRNTEGMLTKGATLPSVLGAPSPQENAADLQTRGFELSLGYNDSFEIGNDSFEFSVVGTLSNSKTKITRFDNPNNSLSDFYEGMTIGELWGYDVEGLFQTEEEVAAHADQTRVSNRIVAAGGLQPGDVKYTDLNNDGVIDDGENTLENPGDRKILGNTAPQYLYSFKLNAAYKGFDFSAFFQGVGKQDWYPNRDSRLFWAMYNRPYDSFIRKDMVGEIWTPENTDAYYPRLFGYIALSESDALGAVNNRYLQSVAYLRMKNLTLGYTLPSGITERMPFNKLRLYFSGENLLTFSKLTDYIDPEAASNSVNLNSPSTSTNRSTAQSTPFSKIYSLGISLQF